MSVAKKIIVGSSIAIVATAQWKEVMYGEDAIILAISFTDKDNGFFPYGDSDGSVGMRVTADGGKTWKAESATQFSSLLMDAAGAGANGVVGGLFDTQYSSDQWQTWNASDNKDKFISQSCDTVGLGKKNDQFFGIVGSDFAGGNGVAISTNGGKHFTFTNITQLTTLARYGAYPSTQVFYVSAGMWPSSEAVKNDPTLVREISAHLRVHKTANGAHKLVPVLDIAKERGEQPQQSGRGLLSPPPPTPGWIGQIVTSKDAGKTWTSSFIDTGNLYFNDIDCGDETHCCASADGAQGSYIYCTSDGSTWSKKVFIAGSDHSMMSMVALSKSEFWAGGGTLSSTDFTGIFMHTTDGGNTWTNQTLAKVYIDDIDFGDMTHGWASTLDRNSLSGIANFGY